ncbi:MAG: hypothetical protein NC123_04085 [Butyrivibrio sp.]|nr:hypothetical protein [Acetatifactor muris]MCM1558709.1 hypothetical protein [Butyrivibrio sp.]
MSIYEYDEEATRQAIREEEYERGMERGMEQGMEQGIKQGIEKGMAVLILDNIESGVPKKTIIAKLVKGFEISAARAEAYYESIEKTDKSGNP